MDLEENLNLRIVRGENIQDQQHRCQQDEEPLPTIRRFTKGKHTFQKVYPFFQSSLVDRFWRARFMKRLCNLTLERSTRKAYKKRCTHCYKTKLGVWFICLQVKAFYKSSQCTGQKKRKVGKGNASQGLSKKDLHKKGMDFN